MKNIASIISQPRFNTYLKVTKGDYTKALELYEWNIKISSAFYVVIQSLEVSLRNRLLLLLDTKKLNWHKENTSDFLLMSKEQRGQIKKVSDQLERNQKRLLDKINKQILISEKKHDRKMVDKLKNQINRHSELCRYKIISELSFGFWKIMFSKRYRENGFWNGQSFKETFPFYNEVLVSDIKPIISRIEAKMENIRTLRNRISQS